MPEHVSIVVLGAWLLSVFMVSPSLAENKAKPSPLSQNKILHAKPKNLNAVRPILNEVQLFAALNEGKLRAALKVAENKYGSNSQQVLDILYRLMVHMRSDPKYRDELPSVVERMVSIAKHIYSSEHKDVADILAVSGLILAEQRLNDIAEPMLVESLQIFSKVGGPSAKSLLKIIDTLGSLYYRAGRYKDALPLSKRSLVIREKVLGLEHLETATNLNDLAGLYIKMSQYDQALLLYRRVLTIRKKQLGPEHPATAISLNNLAVLYYNMGRYEKALPLYQRALMILEKGLGREHPDTVTGLNNLAWLYIKMGQYDLALPLFQRALAINEKVLGLEHPTTVISLNNLARLHSDMGQYGQALPMLQRALTINGKVLGAEHPYTATSLNNLANLHSDMGQYDQALPLYQRALSIREKVLGPEHPDTATSRDNLANLHSNMGQYDQALPLYQRALSIREKVLGPEHLDTATSLNNLAELYRNMGQYERALPLYLRALAIREKVLGPEHLGTATNLNNLAVLYSNMAQYDQALSLDQRALAIREKALGPEHPVIAVSLNSLAVLYYTMGNYARALPLYQRALAINEKVLGLEHPYTATSLNNLAWFYINMGQYDQALPLARRALAINEKVLRLEHMAVATSLNCLAVLYSAIGQYEQALPLYQRALAISEKVLGAGPRTATSLNNLAGLYRNMGQYEKALPLYQRALAISEKALGPEHPSTATSLNNLGYLYINTGEYDSAGVALHKAVTILQSNPGGREILWRAQYGLSMLYTHIKFPDLAILWGKESVNAIQSLRAGLKSLNKKLQSGFLTNKKHVYTKLADLLITEGRIGEAQAVLQMLKEQELYDSLQRSSKTDPRSTRIELTGLERKRFARYYELQDQQAGLGKERSKLERKQKLGEISKAEKKRLTEINDKLLPPLRKAMLVFLQNLQKQSDQFAKGKAYRQNEASFEVVETNLQNAMTQVLKNDPDSRVAALQYVVTDNRLSILLSTPNNPPIARQVEFDGKALRSQIFSLRELLRDPKSDRAFLKEQLHDLYTRLIVPVVDDLKTLEVKTLILVPNDVLRYVPFAALYDGKRYLVQNYALTLFNEAVRKDFSHKPAKTWQLVAMGLSLPVENLPALTNVSDELNAVAIKSGMKGKTYLDDAFTRAVLKDSLNKNFNVLHLASHFEFVAGRPDASRLFLGDKSSLYLGDIARENMRFDHFSLVTFSACETGLGGGLDADGRDMESLGALVQNQGARAVMATLWKVADSSTPELMELFYRYYHKEQLSKAEALRKAQLRFIKGKSSGHSVLAHPYYWAPFVLMGDWR